MELNSSFTQHFYIKNVVKWNINNLIIWQPVSFTEKVLGIVIL
jgi:hypothetical protein